MAIAAGTYNQVPYKASNIHIIDGRSAYGLKLVAMGYSCIHVYGDPLQIVLWHILYIHMHRIPLSIFTHVRSQHIAARI